MTVWTEFQALDDVEHQSFAVRAAIMFLLVFPFFTVLFGYDVIGALGNELYDYLQIDAAGVGLLYLVYGSMAPVMAITTGPILDRIGAYAMCISTSFMATIGAVVIVWGIMQHSFWLVSVGRLLTGFGEALLVTVCIQLSRSFTGTWSEMGFAGTVVTGQVGNVLVFFALPVMVQYLTIPHVYIVCACIYAAALGTCIGYVLLDRWKPVRAPAVLQEEADESVLLLELKQPPQARLCRPLPLSVWLIGAIRCFSAAPFYVFVSFAPQYIVEVTSYSSEQTGFIVAAMNAIVIGAPGAGWIISRIGMRCEIWFGSAIMLCIAFVALSFVGAMDPIGWVMLVGASFAWQAASVTAAVALVVEQEEFSWAYSIESFMFTVALCILPYIFGELRSWSGSYRLPMLFLAGLNCIALVVIVVLYVVDRRRGQALRRPAASVPAEPQPVK